MKANIFISNPRIGYITDVDCLETPYYEVVYLNSKDQVTSKNFDTMNEVQKHLSKFRIMGFTRYIKY